MIGPPTARICLLLLAGFLLVSRSFEARAAEHAVTFDVHGTRFYVPKAWTITPAESVPRYNPSLPISPQIVFRADRGILLNFSESARSSAQRYPEITFPFPYEVAIDVVPPELVRVHRGEKKAGNPMLAEQLAGRTPDVDGFVKLGPQRYVAVLSGDDDGAGGYLEFICQAGLKDADSSVSRRCTTYTYVLDAIKVRTVFDGAKYDKPNWRAAPKQAAALIKWLITQPGQRSEEIKTDISGANR
jgi:hypothetical protein